MSKFTHLLTILFVFLGFLANAQDVIWTGSASNNDFFDEGNWRNSSTNVAPAAGTINPATAINLSLRINTVTPVIIATGEINLGSGTLVIGSANLKAPSLSGGGGIVTITEGGYIELTDTTPFKSSTPRVQVNLTSGIGWVKATNVDARFFQVFFMSNISVNGSSAVYKTNLRLDNYYLKGCVVRSLDVATSPLLVYDAASLQGTAVPIPVNVIHKGNAIPGAMSNKIESFLLRKGFMATFADEADGTGKSKNYIASETDLVINVFPKLLQNSISFIRVMPWNWVTKKGRNQTDIDLNTSWRYQWNHTEMSTVNWEFAPMSWGHGTANDDQDIVNFANLYNTTHLMSFNEPDDCDSQSGQWGTPKLCTIDEAVRLHKNLTKTGMRIVSPGGREEAPFGWLKQFHEKATAQDIRIDVIAVHWYDWGSSPTSNTNPTAQQVFDRFRAYLTRVHNLYGLPIWITEFNANPARSQAINAGFLELAMPYLESLDYIERYCWFAFNSGTHFYGWDDASNKELNKTLSLVGTVYKNINNITPKASTPSIPEATVDANNNLNLVQFPNIALNKSATANSSYNGTTLPAEAVDGDITTATSQWFLNFGVSTDLNFTPLPAWFEVDLQGTYTVDSFRIIESSRAMKDFIFQVWDGSLNFGAGGWAEALAVTGNPATPLTTYKNITPVTTTKVRLYITAHNSTSFLRMFELEVYGKQVATLAVPQYQKQEFTIYPNPVSNDLLNISGDKEINSVDVYNILGAKINARYENNQVEVSNLTPGVYFLRVNNKYSFKFIKK